MASLGGKGLRFYSVCVPVCTLQKWVWDGGGNDYGDAQPLQFTTTSEPRTLCSEDCVRTMGNCKGWNLPERLRLQVNTFREQVKRMCSEGSSRSGQHKARSGSEVHGSGRDQGAAAEVDAIGAKQQL